MQQQALNMYMGQLTPKAPLILKEGEIAYNPTTYAKMFEGGSKSPFGNVNPASFTPASLKAFMDSGGKNFDLLLPAVSADTQARLTQETEQNAIKLKQEREISDRAFNNLSDEEVQYKTVAYQKFIPILIAAAKQLSTQVRELSSKSTT
jgi:hypothetical protein